MTTATNASLWPGKTRTAPIPPTRDPFVNTPLLKLPPDPQTGKERFWTSTWNASQGTLAALVDEDGQARIFRFGDRRFPGFYSAAVEDENTLWLCGWLDEVVRFDLRSGEREAFPTGAPRALVFQGMVLDSASGKLFAAAFPPPKVYGFVFDFRARRAVRSMELPFDGHYMRTHFRNGDGTWSIVTHLPGEHLLIWDPATDLVEGHTLRPARDSEETHATTYRVIQDERGRTYVPGLGWYDPAARGIDAGGPRPRREMTWFARAGGVAFGSDWEGGVGTLGRWDMSSGEVRELARVPDAHMQSFSLTASGKIVAVTLYGQFLRFDGETGALEVSKRLEADALGSVDCLLQIDERRVLGTPFITQRFWEVDLETGEGQDCGRAAPGAGEVLQTWRLGDKVYMAAYTGGELMAYDPARPARFPENPHVVADPPGGMRPVARADDGRCLFYSCSHHYGQLGCVLTRYDTHTGVASYHDDPLPAQQINSLMYDPASRTLLAGTTIHADCNSCPPTAERAVFARFRAEDLSLVQAAAAPVGVEAVRVLGPLGAGRWMALCYRPGQAVTWFELDDDLAVPEAGDLRPMVPAMQSIHYADVPGRFVLKRDHTLEVWDFRGAEPAAVRLLQPRDVDIAHVEVQGDTVLFSHADRVAVMDHCLAGL